MVTPPKKPEAYQFSVNESQNIERIIRHVVNSSKATSVASRNNIYDKTKQLLRVCHARVCQLDLAAMLQADIRLVLEDLGTLKRNLNVNTAHMDYGTRLHFALNVVYRRRDQAA
ncbi:hypothetical protein [Acetobacter pasteurianus]|uniref:Uncharacterized protein n=1 Tax=Acetobacter pasteurianus subsp. pasteurianus TaxID=481145 RepID=A0A1Y0YCK8_ACEPA|nr:hypothetical protein [Acetobacter pasteurianus]ARW48705.1 hypothetical protein S1001342_02406 [Acetobacter pasteurianus subsp. pasteurianus]